MKNKKSDQHAGIVTGGASGMGEAIVERLLAEGGAVAALDRDEERLANLRGRVGCDRLLTISCDVSDEDAAVSAVQEVSGQFARVDYLVNCAGISGDPAPFRETASAGFDTVISVNLRGTFYMMREVICLMRESGGGSIVNISSISGVRGTPNLAGYSASKFGVVGLTLTAALEEAPSHIRVNAICPGIIHTPMYDRNVEKLGETVSVDLIPLGRLGAARDIANLAVWLIGEESSYITGQAIVVDGGLTLQ